MNRTTLSIYGIEMRRTLLLALPITLGQVAHVLLGVIDSMMVGQLGATTLAASALANSLFINFLVFGFGLSSCISVLTSHADGAQQPRECGEVLRHGLFINIVLGVVMVTLIEMMIPLSRHLQQPADVVEEMIPFLRLITLSIIPALIGQSFKTYSEGLRDTMLPMIITISAIPLNIGFNYLLIYGNFGFPALGLEGAGYGTLITRVICAIALAWLVIRDPRKEPYQPTQWWTKIDQTRIAKMLKVGLPTAFQVLFEVAAFSLSAVMMGWLGTKALAAHQITINLASLLFMAPMGISFAISVRIGGASGAADWRAARRIGWTGLFIATVLAFAFSAILVLSRHIIPSWYLDDEVVLAISAQLFLVAAAFQLFDGIQVVAVGALRGLLDLKIPTLITFVAYWVLALPLGYLFGLRMDLAGVGVWTGLSLGLAFAAILLSVRFYVLSQKRVAAENP